MSDGAQDLRTMPEARLREWFEGLPKEELVEMLVSHVLVYQRDRADGGAGGGLEELRELTFGQLMDRLKQLTSHPELSRVRVDGERVVYVTDTGIEVPINATGERDPGPSLGRQSAPMTPPAPAERPPDAHVIDPPQPSRPAPAPAAAPARRPSPGGPMFGGGGAPERRAGTSVGRPKQGPPGGGKKDGGGGGKKGGGSLLEF